MYTYHASLRPAWVDIAISQASGTVVNTDRITANRPVLAARLLRGAPSKIATTWYIGALTAIDTNVLATAKPMLPI